MIPPTVERLYCRCFLLRGVPGFPVHPRCSPPVVFRHSFDGKGFAAKRVGQQTLQGFHLAPSAFLRCLHDTRLEPTDLLVSFLPVNGMPVHAWVRGCTRRCAGAGLVDEPRYSFRHLLCLLSRLTKCSRDKRPDGSLPAFA